MSPINIQINTLMVYNKYCVEIDEIRPFSLDVNQKLIDFCFDKSRKFHFYRSPLEVTESGLTENSERGFYGHSINESQEFSFIDELFLGNGIQVNWGPVHPAVQKISGGMNPHSDGNHRNFSLVYNIYGPAITSFFLPKGKWIPHKAWSYDEVVMEESFELKLNTWYLFNNYQIHDVVLKNVGRRAALLLNLHNLFSTWEEATSNWQKIFIKY
jgi:hypothetical protein